MLSAHAWIIIGICAGFLAGMYIVFRSLCGDEPDNAITHESGEPQDEEPDGMLAAA